MICLGSGTVTIPYVFYANGIILSSILVIAGGILSYYTGWLIAYCAAMTGGKSFEEIAFKLYGEKGMRIVSFCNICCNIGFLINYAVLFKTSMPTTLKLLGCDLPHWLGNNGTGKLVWNTIFCFVLLVPLCLPMQLGSLRYASMSSILITFFIVGTISTLSFRDSLFDDSNDEPFIDRMHMAMTTDRTNMDSVFSALPYIIFSYMYQPCIPQIYHEMKVKSLTNIKKVLFAGTFIASFAYIAVGIFGYVTFASRPDVDKLFDHDKNILQYYPKLPVAEACLLGLIFVVTFATPFCLVPAKIAIMELTNKPGQEKTAKQNFAITIGLLVITYLIALFCSDIGDAMSILGPTTNTGIGFVIPIILYLKYDKIAATVDRGEDEERLTGNGSDARGNELWELKQPNNTQTHK